jgi:hypothetical protein
MLQRIIAAQPEIAGRPFVFATGHGVGYRASHKRALDKRLKAELGALEHDALEPWVVHDLRALKDEVSGAQPDEPGRRGARGCHGITPSGS